MSRGSLRGIVIARVVVAVSEAFERPVLNGAASVAIGILLGIVTTFLSGTKMFRPRNELDAGMGPMFGMPLGEDPAIAPLRRWRDDVPSSTRPTRHTGGALSDRSAPTRTVTMKRRRGERAQLARTAYAVVSTTAARWTGSNGFATWAWNPASRSWCFSAALA